MFCLRAILIATVFVLMFVSSTTAQPPVVPSNPFNHSFEVGDEVFYNRFRSWHRGTIIRITGPILEIRPSDDELDGMGQGIVRLSASRVREPNANGEMPSDSESDSVPRSSSRSYRSILNPDSLRQPADPNSRLWMDASGKHVIRASMTDQNESSVTLLRADGTTTSLDIKRLSVGDQRFLKAKAKAETANDTDENAAESSSIPTAVRKFTSIPITRLSSKSNALRAPSEDMWMSSPFISDLKAELIALDRDGRLVLAHQNGESRASRESLPKSIIFNTQTDEVVGQIDWPADVRVLDYDAVYDHLLIGVGIEQRTKFGFLVALSGLRSFELQGIGYVDATFFQHPEVSRISSKGKRFEGGAIAGDQFLVQRADLLSLVPIGESKVRDSTKHSSSVKPALSHDRRFIAFNTETEVAVVDLKSSKRLRSFPIFGDSQPLLAFSPNGRMLAAKTKLELVIYDLNQGQRVSDASSTGLTNNSDNLLWLDDKNVLVMSSILYNLDAQSFVWKYSYLPGIRTPRGLTRPSFGRELIAYKIPHAAARQWIAEVGTNPESVLIDQSEPTQVLVDTSPAIYDRVFEIAESVGKKSGWNIQPEASTSLIAKVQQTEDSIEVTVRYPSSSMSSGIGGFGPSGFGPRGFGPSDFGPSDFGSGNGPTRIGPSGFGSGFRPPGFGPSSSSPPQPSKPPRKIKIRPYHCELMIRRDGENLWKWSKGLQNGASVYGRTQESDEDLVLRLIQPNLSAMKDVFIPRKIVDKSEQTTLRSSKVSPRGFEDEQPTVP